MGVDCSCLRDDPRLNKDEMTMQETKKSAIVQESAQENDKPEVLVDFQLPNYESKNDNIDKEPSKPETKEDYTGIQSAARGYLDRKELSAMKEIHQATKTFNPETVYEPYNGSLSSKVSSKVKKVEKQWGAYSPEASNDNSNVTAHPAFIVNEDAVYEGEWNEDGEKHGLGTEIDADGSKYVGYFRNDKRDGDGRLITAEGDLYQGDFKRGQLNGKGVLHRFDGTKYEGAFKNGVPHGEGREEAEGWNYTGNYRYGMKHGKGLFSLENGSSYKGEFKNNNMEGNGHYVWNDGKEYEGEWKDNKMHGNGVFTWPDGRKYEGEYVADEKHGNGVFTWPDGKIYDGEWNMGKQDGKGKLTFPTKKNNKFETRSGIWKNGVRTQWLKAGKDEE